MLKSCKYCGRIHDTKYDCGKKPTSKKTTNITKFRSSSKWQRKREIILSLDHYLCALCKSQSVYNSKYLEVHHIIPLAEDFSRKLDEDNLITLCELHHEEADKGIISRQELAELIEERYRTGGYPPA